jgi:8-oxo-dGTP diphosphatase
MKEETGLTIEAPRLCGIKEFHKAEDGKRYIVFLYIADKFTGELKASNEGEIFWYPLSELAKSDKLIYGFGEMLKVFTNNDISEIYYGRTDDVFKTVYC